MSSTTASDLVEELNHTLSARGGAAAVESVTALVQTGHLDEALDTLAAHAGRDPSTLELLIETLDASGTVHRFAGAALLDKTAVDDVAQDALISVVESIGSYNGRGKFTTWVHSIVRRRVVDHLRRQRESIPLPEDEAAPAARMSSMIATRATVRKALDALPELYRMPVILRDVEGRTYAEIAEQLDRPEGTVKAQISRGRAMVAAQLRDHDGQDAS